MKITDFTTAIAATKNPAKLAIAVVKDKKDMINLITLEWFMRTSIKPPMCAISIGHTRYSYECLQNFRYFNLCFPSKEMVYAAEICGTKSGRDVNKLELIGLDWISGKLKKIPIFMDALANFECEVVTQVKSGDHTIYVGEVQYSWLKRNKSILLFEDIFKNHQRNSK